jgi:hypothetical protein
MGHVDLMLKKDARLDQAEATDGRVITGETCAPAGRSALFAASATDAAARMFPDWLCLLYTSPSPRDH